MASLACEVPRRIGGRYLGQNGDGFTPLDIAWQLELMELVKYLENIGYDDQRKARKAFQKVSVVSTTRPDPACGTCGSEYAYFIHSRGP
jgi:hypothetical protein